jgi:hypothetical protein
MADGLSLESLFILMFSNFRREADEVSSYIPSNWTPLPGRKRCMVAPYLSGNGTEDERC